MRVEKWHGAGNDFLVVDGRGPVAPRDWAAWTRAACDRRRGVGADGLLVLEPDPELDFRMRYRNADGGEAQMCGNGGRVLAAFALERGLGRGGSLRFRSRWGAHRAVVEARGGGDYRVSLSLPDVTLPGAQEFPAPWGRTLGVRVDCGVPHLVLPLAQTPARTMDETDVKGWGAWLRRLPELGPKGANVDFVAGPADGLLLLRTYERGVEDETLACGTGAAAVAAAAVALGWSESPVRIRTRGGDVLEVTFRVLGDRLAEVVLHGPATRVFETEFEPG